MILRLWNQLSHDYLNGNISGLLIMICCASVNKQDVSDLANLKKNPKCCFRQHGTIIRRMVRRCVVHAALLGHQQEQRVRC